LVLHDFWGADGSCEPWGRRPEPGAGPAAALLARLCGVNRRTVYRALGDLEARGWVKVTFRSQGRDSNRYVATIPAAKKAKPRHRSTKVTAESFPEFANDR
jgi:DNA-binding transcriptional regulator YhcF (GntR family)